jgi:hypothetical protein
VSAGATRVDAPPGLDAWLVGELADRAPEIRAVLRGEDEVLGASALRAMAPTRLSFARTLVARIVDRGWRIERRHLEIDGDGIGCAVYGIEAEGVELHFGAFCDPPVDGPRQGRIAEERFDFFGALMEGPVDRARLQRDHRAFLEHAWRGRTDNGCLGWSVANRSARLFDHVVERLAAGVQPDEDRLAGGYLIRNAGFYGNGRHGTRSWGSLPVGHPLAYPYHVDLFTLYLWRLLALDVVEAAAGRRAPTAATLAPATRRELGIGNSSGIGTGVALLRWPAWLSAYTSARELALAAVRSLPAPRPETELERVAALLDDAARAPGTTPAAATVLSDAASAVRAYRRTGRLGDGESPTRPWLALSEWTGRQGNREALERLHAVLIEARPQAADALARRIPEAMAVERGVTPEMTVEELRRLLRDRFDWALDVDLDAPGARERFWYRSEDNGENRRGERALDPGAERETFVDVIGVVQALADALAGVDGATTVGRFLLERPEHALAVSRVQLAGRVAFSEVRANYLAADFVPADAIGYFLAVLGIDGALAVSPQWVRGVFFGGAELPEDVEVRR